MMMDATRVRAFVALAAILGGTASAQTESKLKARELFYTPVSAAPSQKSDSGDSGKEPAKKNDISKTTPKKTPPKTSGGGSPAEPPYLDARKQTPNVPTHQTPNTQMNGGVLVNASTTSSIPLAVRCTVKKRNSDGDFTEVDSATAFRSGEKIRVTVEPNDDGYLYIVTRGSSKQWNVLFPSPDIDGGNNRVTRNRMQTVPSKRSFFFDDTPGTERVFIVFTRKPVPDLEKLIYSLGSGAKESTPNAAPTAAPVESPAPKTMVMASSRPIEDPFIDRLRSQIKSRDLVFDKVDDEESDHKEKAIYVATPDRSANAKVVVDLALKHQ
jgi:hypothetical protein